MFDVNLLHYFVPNLHTISKPECMIFSKFILCIFTGTKTKYDPVSADVQEIHWATEQNKTGYFCQRKRRFQRQEPTITQE
jgi:hypothetical protein